MKFPRPVLKQEALECFFEKADQKTDKGKLRKYAAATLWYLDRGLVRVWDADRG